jgi:hypothetical protein
LLEPGLKLTLAVPKGKEEEKDEEEKEEEEKEEKEEEEEEGISNKDLSSSPNCERKRVDLWKRGKT